ncbi:hypothetical protein Q2T42_02780 [Leptolyngbya boryana CZ1]|uniref:Uncharacterized protein n=1 Tax=Leptolyngbya boryana CZ1 TaxID=3060204 RepID=A0AA97API1_LEPBY|nr:hypothetical protein [Leptolyngbya boryana]WNZ46763.1 hypothetical protein Q2T42_02780 [Leptolyngbya boryana CZ1]
MSFLSRSASVLVGLAGLVAVAAAPASAQNASVSGAITRTSPAGFTTTVSGEIVAPEGVFFSGNYSVTGTADSTAPVLNINGFTGFLPTAGSSSLLEQVVANTLGGLDPTTEAGLDAYAAILKAAAGVDGLESNPTGGFGGPLP